MEIPPHFTKTGAGDVPTLPPVNPANSQPIMYELSRVPCAILVDGELLSSGLEAPPPLPAQRDVSMSLVLNSSLPGVAVNFQNPPTIVHITPSIAKMEVEMASEKDNSSLFQDILAKAGQEELADAVYPHTHEATAARLSCRVHEDAYPYVKEADAAGNLNGQAAILVIGQDIEIICVVRNRSAYLALDWIRQLLDMPGTDNSGFALYHRDNTESTELNLRRMMLKDFKTSGRLPPPLPHLLTGELYDQIQDLSDHSVKGQEKYMIAHSSDYLALLMIANFRDFREAGATASYTYDFVQEAEYAQQPFGIWPTDIDAVARERTIVDVIGTVGRDEEQLAAIYTSLRHMLEEFLVLTGGPGTGKTMCLCVMVAASVLHDSIVSVCAATNQNVDEMFKTTTSLLSAVKCAVKPRLVRRLTMAEEQKIRKSLWDIGADNVKFLPEYSTDTGGVEEMIYNASLAKQSWRAAWDSIASSPDSLTDYKAALIDIRNHCCAIGNPAKARTLRKDLWDAVKAAAHRAESHVLRTSSAVFASLDTTASLLESEYEGGQSLFVDNVSLLNVPRLLSVFPTSSRYNRVVLAGDPCQAPPHPRSKAAKWNEAGQLLTESIFKSRFTRLLDGQILQFNTSHYHTDLMVQLLNELKQSSSVKSPLMCAQHQRTHPFAASARSYRANPNNVLTNLERFSQWDFENKDVVFVDVKHRQNGTSRQNPKATSAFLQVLHFLTKDLSVDERTISFMSMDASVASSMASKLEGRHANVDARSIDSSHDYKNDIVWIDLGVIDGQSAHPFGNVGRLIAAASKAAVLLMICGDLKALRGIRKLQNSRDHSALSSLIKFVDDKGLVFRWEPSLQPKSSKRQLEEDNASKGPISDHKPDKRKREEDDAPRPQAKRPKRWYSYQDPDAPSYGTPNSESVDEGRIIKKRPTKKRNRGAGSPEGRPEVPSDALCYD